MEKKGALQTFRVPAERMICVPVEDLQEDLKGCLQLEGDGALLSKVFRLLECTSQIDFLSVRRRIIRNFGIFALAAAQKPLPAGKAPTPEELDERELVFLEDMHALLQAAHFRMLRAEEWATAQAESFTFNCPVDVNWDFMDGSLLRRFWAGHPEDRAAAAPICDRVLVYMRGITTVRACGMYINDKIDLLVQYLLIDPFQALYSRITKREAKLHIALELNDMTADQGYTVSQGPPATVDHSSHCGDAARGAGGSSAGIDADDPRLQHDAVQTVQRRTLRQLMPDTASVLRNLTKTLQIQEPAFKEVVILYRRKVPDKPPPTTDYESIKPHNPALEARNMCMKRFTDIPMADTEVVFPDKRVFLRPLLVIQLSVAIIGALAAGAGALLSDKLSGQLLLTFLGIMAGRAMQIYFSASAARTLVVEMITKKMYECTQDAQEGVVTFVLEECAQQRIKENLLAYALLQRAGKPMSQAELDAACERHLAERFGERRDFAIENSLPTLLQDGLISRGAQGKLEAVPVGEAYDRLARKWEHYFERQEEEEKAVQEGGDSAQPGKPGRASALFQRFCARPSFPGLSRSGGAKEEAAAGVSTQEAAPGAATARSEPATSSVDSKAGVINLDSNPARTAPLPSASQRGGAPATPEAQLGVLAAEPFHDVEEDMDGNSSAAQGGGGSGSKRQKLKEGLSSLFGKAGPKKDQ